MKKELLLVILLFSFLSNAQKINFTYDGAGNQINRAYCFQCPSSQKKAVKEIEALVEEDMEKFFPEDVISYYPNPVKEELFLKWIISEDNYVSSINIVSMAGQMLKQYHTTSGTATQNIPFQEYPTGVYIVLLNYSNGEQKTIKIIKK